jgi:hypothetical protein
MLPRVCATFGKEGNKSVKVLRIVSNDAETLNEAHLELEYWRQIPTYPEPNNH